MKRAQSESLLSSKIKNTNTIEDPNLINYVFDPPSLKSIAMVTVALKIYGCPYDGESDVEDEDGGIPGVPIASEETAFQRLERIALPQSLKHEVSDIIKSVEQEWRVWNDFALREGYEKFIPLKKVYNDRGLSCWTMDGVVDDVKLLEDVLDSGDGFGDFMYFDCSSFYETACTYCMEEYISKFRSKLPKKKGKFKCYVRNCHFRFHIVAYWNASFSNELSGLLNEILRRRRSFYIRDYSINENMSFACILSGNLVAFKYFWNLKLTEEEKRSNTKKWIVLALEIVQKEYFECYDENFDLSDDNTSNSFFHPLPSDDIYFDYKGYTSHTYILFFLLTHLDSHSEQKEIFKSNPKVILLSLFYHWPLQRCFLPTITIMLDFLNENTYVGMMKTIANSMSQTRAGVLFREIWDISPPNLKKAFLNYLKHRAKVIIQMLFIGDDMTIDRILRNATVDEKRRILFRAAQETEFFMLLRSFRNSDKKVFLTIDRLASKTLSEKDFHSFKLDVMSRYGKDLSSHWIVSKDFSSLNIFWNWTCQSLEECRNFKKKYINLEEQYISLLVSGEWEHVDEFLNFYFETENEINEFKKSFAVRDNLSYCVGL